MVFIGADLHVIVSLSKSHTVLGMVCIFTALLFLKLQECPGAEDDLLVPLKLVDPVSFRLFADRPDRVFDSKPPHRFCSKSLAIETAAERIRFRVL